VDNPRAGKPRKYGREIRDKILKTLETPPLTGQSTCDGASLAAAVGASDQAVWKILQKEGIQLQRSRSWCVSTDKEFSAKSADIIGLYLNPPENALVICVDEKPSIQAIERKRKSFIWEMFSLYLKIDPVPKTKIVHRLF
jgi:hypothetical protein